MVVALGLLVVAWSCERKGSCQLARLAEELLAVAAVVAVVLGKQSSNFERKEKYSVVVMIGRMGL